MRNPKPDPIEEQERRGRHPLALLAGSILIGLAVAIVLFGDGLLSSGGDREEISVLEQLPDTRSSPIGVLPSSSRLIEVDDRAPDFMLEDLDGNAYELSTLRGRPVVINFWATWCVPCRVEMPELQAAYEQHQEERLAILALNYDEPVDSVRSFFYDEMGLTFTPLLDVDGLVAEEYGVFNFPSTFFINAEGVVKSIHRGPMVRQQVEDHLSRIIPTG